MAIQTNKDVTEITYNGVNIPLYHKTQTKDITITSNGTTVLNKDADYDGMTSVEIYTDVPCDPLLQGKTKTYTSNITSDVIGYDGGYDGLEYVEVTVNVPQTTVEPLSVTENGTYTAPSGTAYSPVTVNVSGGSSEPVDTDKQVLFIDYDGTPLHSYTYDEAMALTSLPANPSQAGLTAQGWNWTLANIQAYLTTYPNADLVVGQNYVTSDGKTRLYVELPKGSVTFTARMYLNGTAVIDWGDGTSTSTLTGTSLSTQRSTTHTYANAGNYTITITVTGQFTMQNGFVSSVYFMYSGIKKVLLGSGLASIKTQMFNNFYGLEKVSIPTLPSGSVIETNAFSTCRSLKAIVVPSTVTDIAAGAFGGNYRESYVSTPYNCTLTGNGHLSYNYMLERVNTTATTTWGTGVFQSTALRTMMIPSGTTAITTNFCNGIALLKKIEIPASVTSIAASAFSNATTCEYVKFYGSTPPTLASTNCFSNLNRGCIIYVPSGSLSAYTSAANYPSSSTYAYVEY